MKKLITPSVFLLFLLLQMRVSAQEILNLKHSCSFDGDQEDTEIYANEPSDEATKVVRKIMALNVLQQNFIIKSGNCKNALAATEGKQRYILYSTTFLESFKGNDNARWAAFCVMAHEIGHHLNYHDMEEVSSSKRKLMEIQSDKFAGGILFRLGASLPQAQAGILLYTDDVGSKTHPPKSARLEALASGWKQAQEQQRSSIDDASVKDEPKVIEKEQSKQNKPNSLLPPLPFIEPEMVYVQGGTFQMGSNHKESLVAEKPIHPVTVGNFYIGKTEVTQKQWRMVMGSYPIELNFKGCDDCPVESVSWDDVQEFLQKLNTKSSNKYRLPTDAEWEYAAKGGNKSRNYKFSGSNTKNDVAWCTENSNDKTHPVGTLKANELGIYDMSGNVREWCQDVWHDNFVNAPDNGSAWLLGGDQSSRIIRGGSWGQYSNDCNTSNRNRCESTTRFAHHGFRLSRQ